MNQNSIIELKDDNFVVYESVKCIRISNRAIVANTKYNSHQLKFR